MFSSVSLLSVGRAEQKALRTQLSILYCASVRDVATNVHRVCLCCCGCFVNLCGFFLYRIGLDQYLGENFDPMSTAERDMRVFRECVSQLQQREGLNECQSGSMCANTIHKMKQLLHTQRQKS